MRKLLVLAFLFAGCSPDPPELEDDVFVTYCKRLLGYYLVSPSSLEINSLFFSEETHQPEDTGETFDRFLGPDDPGYYMRTGYVSIKYDASNAFGAMIRGTISCEMAGGLHGFGFLSATINGQKISRDDLDKYRWAIREDIVLEELEQSLNKR